MLFPRLFISFSCQLFTLFILFHIVIYLTGLRLNYYRTNIIVSTLAHPHFCVFVSFSLKLRGCQLVEALRLHKQGYPEHMSFHQFRRQFAVLAPAQLRAGPLLDHKAATEAILAYLEQDPASYRLGLSKVMT